MNMRTINAANPAYHKLNSVKDPVVADCVRYLIDELEDSLGIRITYAAENNVTLKFSDSRLGSVSVSSIPANTDYLCRWNLHTGDCIEITGKYKTHWYPIEEANFFVSRVQGYLDTILANTPVELKPPAAPAQIEQVPLDTYVDTLCATHAEKRGNE